MYILYRSIKIKFNLISDQVLLFLFSPTIIQDMPQECTQTKILKGSFVKITCYFYYYKGVFCKDNLLLLLL